MPQPRMDARPRGHDGVGVYWLSSDARIGRQSRYPRRSSGSTSSCAAIARPDSLAASTWLEHSGWLGLAPATLTVTNVAFACLVLAAILRIWGTAYLGSSIVLGTAMQGTRIVVTGPYRYFRHPLYLGSWLLGLGISILMPLGGAIFFLITFSLLVLQLLVGEERFLSAEHHKAAAQTASANTVLHHKVKAGETLYSIASSYNTTVSALKHDNRNIASLRPGMILVVRDAH